MQLRGRRVLVTGASRGIGAALVRRLQRSGAQLALVARASADLEAVADAVDGLAYPCDLGVADQVAGLAGRVLADGPVDVLVNNAGLSHVGWFGDRTHDELDQVMAVNLLAPVHLTRDLVPHMLERGGGQVVNLSSMAAVLAPPGLAAYGASKAGLSHFTTGLRADLRDDPIVLTLVHLGSVATDLDAQSRGYGPLRALAERSGGRDVTSLDTVVDRIVAAIAQDRDELRIPRAMAALPALANLPRRLGTLMFRGVPAREARTPAVRGGQ